MGKTKNALRSAAGVPSETVACASCGERSHRTLYEAPSYAMVSCSGCGLCYQSPRVTEAFMRQHYQEEYKRVGEYAFSPDYDPDRLPAKRRQEYLDTIRYAEGFLPAPGRLLEIGCFDGALLYLARQRGWNVAGVEINEALAKASRERLGIEVRGAVLEEARFEPSSFDLVVARHVLEHVYDLKAFLGEVRRVLCEGGLFLVEVPNLDGVEYKFRDLMARFSLGASSWERMNIPQHLYYFTPRSLTDVMRRSRFEPLDCRTYSHRKHRSRLSYAIQRLRHRIVPGTKMRMIARKTA